ncbi:MAG: mechanosensitive ion channel family protein [Thermoplasmata archaeon]|nr:mechanosensitive ion channel family protein [Thermoplasmata archaeon]
MATILSPFSFRETIAIVLVVAVVIGGYLLSRTAAERARRRGAPPHAVRASRIAISVLAALLALAIVYAGFGPFTLVSSLTVSAVVGLAATLALQTTLGKVIAGFLLLRSRVLRLNDELTISGVHGRVVKIGLVNTWLRMDDGALASVSNSTLLSGPMINRSAGERLRGEY